MNRLLHRLPWFVAALLAAATLPAALADSTLGKGIERALDMNRVALAGIGRYPLEVAAATLYTSTHDEGSGERHWRAAVDAAGTPRHRLFALQMLCESLLISGRYDEGIRYANAWLTLAETENHAGHRVQATAYLGRVARRRGELDESLRFQERAAQIARNADRPADLATVLVNLGTVLRDMGRFSEAMDQQMQALEIREKLGPGNRLDVPLRNIGLLYREIEDTQTAREYLEKAVSAAREEFDPAALSSALGSYATLLNDLGEATLALDTARRALAIDERRGDRQGIALERLESARALISLKRWEQAEAEIDSALRLGESMRQADVQGRALLYRGDLAKSRGNLNAAESAYGKSLEHLTRTQLKPQLHAAYRAMEELLDRRGAVGQALAYARQRAGLREELLGVTAARRLAVLELKQARERAERQVELLRLDNSVKALKLQTETLRRKVGIATIASLFVLLVLVFWRWREAKHTAKILVHKNAEISEQDKALRAANQRLTEKSEELHRAATTDPLTALSNRGHVMKQMIEAFDSHKARGARMSLLLIDLDRFKSINDSLGHQFGDRVLIAAARILRDEMRDGDPLGRYGGEEFVAALPGIGADEAALIAERLRHGIQSKMRTMEDREIGMTTSIGLAELQEVGVVSLSALIAAADEALYRAKDNGRNRIEIARQGSDRRKPA